MKGKVIGVIFQTVCLVIESRHACWKGKSLNVLEINMRISFHYSTHNYSNEDEKLFWERNNKSESIEMSINPLHCVVDK